MKRLHSIIIALCLSALIEATDNSTELASDTTLSNTTPAQSGSESEHAQQTDVTTPPPSSATDQTQPHAEKSESPEEHATSASQTSDEPDNIIHFFTQADDPDTDQPSGRYWPVTQPIQDHGKTINTASAYIGHESFSEICEEKNQLPHQELHYLGYFVRPTTNEIVYLYGKKDEHVDNDINEETITDDDDDYEDDDEDDE